MATRTWSGAVNGDINNTGNYDGSGALAGEDLLFNSGAVASSLSAVLSVGSMTITSGYTGTMTFAGYDLTYTNNTGFSDDGTGTRNYGNGLTLSGASGVLHIGSGVGAVTATSCVLTMNGTTAMQINIAKTIIFKRYIQSATAVVTEVGTIGPTFQDSVTLLTLGASASLTLKRSWTLNPTASMTAFSLGAGYTLGTAGTGVALSVFAQSSSLTITIPAISISGTAYQLIVGTPTSASGNCIFNFAGNLTLASGSQLYLQNYRSSASNPNAYNLGFGGTYSQTIGTLQEYTGYAAGLTYVNWGSSSYTVHDLNGTASNGNQGTNIHDLGSATISMGGNWIFNGNDQIVSGTSTMILTTTATITLGANSLYNLSVWSTATITYTNTPLSILGSYVDIIPPAQPPPNTNWAGKRILIDGNASFLGGTANWNGATVVVGGTSCTFMAGMTLTSNSGTRMILMNPDCILTTNGVTMPVNIVTANVSFPDPLYVTDDQPPYGTQQNPLTPLYKRVTAGIVKSGETFGPNATLSGTYKGAGFNDTLDATKLLIGYNPQSLGATVTGRCKLPSAANLLDTDTMGTDGGTPGTYDHNKVYTPGDVSSAIAAYQAANNGGDPAGEDSIVVGKTWKVAGAVYHGNNVVPVASNIKTGVPSGPSGSIPGTYEGNNTYIRDLTPSSGSAEGGTRVALTCKNAGATQGTGSVAFGGLAATIEVWGDSEITLRVPAHAVGAVAVVLTTDSGAVDTLPGGYTYTAVAVPRDEWIVPIEDRSWEIKADDRTFVLE